MFNKIKDHFSGVMERRDTTVFSLMLVFGLTGLAASFVLAVEEFILIQDPEAVLSCSLNSILNCASVMKTWQASVFGFPNMFIGLMGFSVVVTVAVAGLSGMKFPKAFMRAAHVSYLIGTLFAYWLFFNSLYAIQVLCPWCLIVTFSCTMLLSAMTSYAVRHNIYSLKKATLGSIESFIDKGYYLVSVISWVALMVALVFLKFGLDLFA